MKRNLRLVGFFIFLLMTSFRCSTIHNPKDCVPWIGDYLYKEKPEPTATGIYKIMEWELSITQERDTCWGLLEITGLQTYVKVLTTISGDSSKVDIIYNKYLDGSEDFKEGDVLFSLAKDSSNILTTWNTLQPHLAEYPAETGVCFTQKKKSKVAGL